MSEQRRAPVSRLSLYEHWFIRGVTTFVRCSRSCKAGYCSVLRGGRVRLTFKDPVSCDELMSSGLTCGDVEVRVVRADSRFRSVHVRDLPSEVSDEDVLLPVLRPGFVCPA